MTLNLNNVVPYNYRSKRPPIADGMRILARDFRFWRRVLVDYNVKANRLEQSGHTTGDAVLRVRFEKKNAIIRWRLIE